MRRGWEPDNNFVVAYGPVKNWKGVDLKAWNTTLYPSGEGFVSKLGAALGAALAVAKNDLDAHFDRLGSEMKGEMKGMEARLLDAMLELKANNRESAPGKKPRRESMTAKLEELRLREEQLERARAGALRLLERGRRLLEASVGAL